MKRLSLNSIRSDEELLRSRPKLSGKEFYGDIPIDLQLEERATRDNRPLDTETKKIYQMSAERLL